MAVYLNRTAPEPDQAFSLTVGPRSLFPMPEYEPVDLSREEVERILDSVVRHEQWFGSLNHAAIRYSTERTNFPPLIAQMRGDLKRQFPELDVTDEAFPYLKPKSSAKHLVAFDSVRFAFAHESSVKDYCQSMVWDGKVAAGIAGQSDNPENYFLLDSRVKCAQRAFRSFPIIGHAGSSFYEDLFDSIMDERPEISVQTELEGTPCYVIQTWNDSWFVDQQDHRVLARLNYRSFSRFTDHREVAPSVYWPMGMVHRTYNDAGQVELEIATTISEFEFEAAPPDSLFKQALIAGVKVHDLRHSSPVVYAYDPDRSQAEWDAINEKIAANSKRDRKQEQSRKAILGKPAPEFGSGRWLNSDPLSMADIKQCGATIGFIGVGCGPCDNMLPSFSEDSTSGTSLKILVFNSGDNDDGIRKKLSPYKVDCPVFVPANNEKHVWGDLFAEYHVHGLPTVVGVDGNGIIQSHQLGIFSDE